MRVIKTLAEYDQMKADFSNEIDSFLKKFDVFLKSTSPSYWRSTGSVYTTIKNFKKDDLKTLKPLELKHLEVEWVRDEVLDDDEKEEWNDTKKYNL